MSYGHAERNLALIRRLEAEMRQLFGNQATPDQEQLPEPGVQGTGLAENQECGCRIYLCTGCYERGSGN
jgi:hypothetical protein